MLEPSAFDLVEPAARPDLKATGLFWLVYLALFVAVGVGVWLAVAGHAAGRAVVP